MVNPSPPTYTEWIDVYGAIYEASTEVPLGFIVQGIRELCDKEMKKTPDSQMVFLLLSESHGVVHPDHAR